MILKICEITGDEKFWIEKKAEIWCESKQDNKRQQMVSVEAAQ